MIPQFTAIVAIDRQHLEELRVAWPTWARNAPECMRRMLVIYDDVSSECRVPEFMLHPDEPTGIGFMTNSRGIVRHGAIKPISDILPESFPRDGVSVTQRERMLTALTHSPRFVDTPYFLKLDTDTVAADSGAYLDESWFDGSPAIIAPRWGYTKPGHWLDTLDRWADVVASGNEKPHRIMSGGIAKSKRIISYAMFGRTDFAKRIVDLVESGGGQCRLPVPSQDTFSWYAATLFGEQVVRLNPAETGWKHCGGNMRKLRELAASVT